MTKKLILVADASIAKIYEAQGLTIKKCINNINAKDLGIKHHRPNTHDSFHSSGHSSGSQPHFYDPHSSPKDLERNDFLRGVLEILIDTFQKAKDESEEFAEIIIAAEPKSLGKLREHFPSSYKKYISKEISKDLVHQSNEEVAKIIFASA